MHNYYALLEIAPTATQRAIKEAFRAKALKNHSDKGGDDAEMALLNEAYQTLYDPQQRAAFDQDWAMYHETEAETQPVSIAGHLDTAGTPFSDAFRKQHRTFLQQYRAKPLELSTESVRTLFKPPEQTVLYRYEYPSAEGESKTLESPDLISLLAQKAEAGCQSLAAITQITTPHSALDFFFQFLQGNIFGAPLQKSAAVFTETILTLKSTPLPPSELALYEGIVETIQILQEGPLQDGQLLLALQKITDYAKQQAGTGLDHLVPLLQHKTFRALTLQALHADWGSPEPLLKNPLNAFDGRDQTQTLIDRLKERLSNERASGKSSASKLLRYVRLLARLETDLQRKLPAEAEVQNSSKTPYRMSRDKPALGLHTAGGPLFQPGRLKHLGLFQEASRKEFAHFYREKAYHILDWMPALIGISTQQILVNTLLQAGVCFQQAANHAMSQALPAAQADERLALQIYLTAIQIAQRATPDVESYTTHHVLKHLAAFQYATNELAELIPALQRRALSIADFFPFYQAPASNIAFIAQEDQTLVLMRELLHALIRRVDAARLEKKQADIDHTHVRLFNQAFEACLKNWYHKTHDPETEECFRLKVMQALLDEKKWTTQALNYNLNAPWTMDASADGWTNPTRTIPFTPESGLHSYKTLHGLELNLKTGDYAFILDYWDPEKDAPYNKLFTLLDLDELFQSQMTSALFSLDSADPELPYHPFNQMRFAPSTLFHSQLLHTMFLTDYLLKFFTTGQEVQRQPPYNLRPIDSLTSHLPGYLKQILLDFQNSQHQESLHRFWIEAEDIPLAVDDKALNDTGNVLFALGELRMVVKKHTMRREVDGTLVDDEEKDEGWRCYVLTAEQQQTLETGQQTLPEDSLIFTEGTHEVRFWEDDRLSKPVALQRLAQPLYQLFKLKRDEHGEIDRKTSTALRLTTRITRQVAKQCDKDHRFTPEFIFAQEFTSHYHEFAQYFPEFGRLRELSKATALVQIMASQRQANQEEIKQSQTLLSGEGNWPEVQNRIAQGVRAEVTQNFERWRQEYSEEKLSANRQKQLDDITRQIGKIDAFSDQHNGYAKQLHKLFKKELVGVPAWSWMFDSVPWVIHDFLRNHAKSGLSHYLWSFIYTSQTPLLDQLVTYDQTQIREEIQKKAHPNSQIETIDSALKGAHEAIEQLIQEKISATLDQSQEHLREKLAQREKVEASFVRMRFGVAAKEEELPEDDCRWVPASFNHTVDEQGNHSRLVYGGVRIAPRVYSFPPQSPQAQAVQQQTQTKAATVTQNYIAGKEAERIWVNQQKAAGENIDQYKKGISTPYGWRFLDAAEYDKSGQPIRYFEIKSGEARYSAAQRMKDEWIRNTFDIPIDLIRVPRPF